MEPRVPQNLIRAGDDDAGMLGIGRADFATHFKFHQGFLHDLVVAVHSNCHPIDFKSFRELSSIACT
jgi:hypothetical protein